MVGKASKSTRFIRSALSTRFIRSAFKDNSKHAGNPKLSRFSQYSRYSIRPWLTDKGEDANWPGLRIAVGKVVCHTLFEQCMSFIILFNACIIVYETDRSAQCFPKYASNMSQCPYNSGSASWVQKTNLGLLGLYTCEALARFYVLRSAYVSVIWNQLDIVVVIAGWIGTFYQGNNLNYLRMLRFTRLTRVFRVLRNIRELYLLISGMGSAIRAVLVSCILLFALLLGFAIATVEWVHPICSQLDFGGCLDCNMAFKSVGVAAVTLFRELIAGGSWLFSQKMVESNLVIAFLMTLASATIILGILNLILTVIVERAAEAREKDVQDMARQKCLNQAEARDDLLKLCEEMDKDDSGELDLNEILEAYENSEEFYYLMTVMDFDKEELQEVFEHADRDQTGRILYEEFCDELFHLKFQNQHLLVGLLRHKLLESSHATERRLSSQIADISLDLQQLKNYIQDLMGTKAFQACDASPVQPLTNEAVKSSAVTHQSETAISDLSVTVMHSPEDAQQVQQQ